MSSKHPQPEIQQIKLHKNSNGMGLSIVAAKGAGQVTFLVVQMLMVQKNNFLLCVGTSRNLHKIGSSWWGS